MKAVIKKGRAFGFFNATTSKSYAHRYLIATYLSGGGQISGISECNDVSATLNCLKILGLNRVIMENEIADRFELSEKIDNKIFDCQESGSTLRFMIPVALYSLGEATFIGSKKLFSRGLGIYQQIFEKQGIKYELDENSLYVEGRLLPDTFEIPGNISSQFISGLLFVLPLLDRDSDINIIGEVESEPYIDMTIKVLKDHDIDIKKEGNRIHIPGRQKYQKHKDHVEFDFSNLAYFEMLNYMGGNVTSLAFVDQKDTLQGDIVFREYFSKLSKDYQEIDLKNCIDLGPILFAFASLFHGAKFININRLRIKESDRVLDTLSILEKFGVKYVLKDNELEILKSELHAPKEEIETFNDHRLVMMTAILLCKYSGTLLGAEAVNKSYPEFFNNLIDLGIEVTLINE